MTKGSTTGNYFVNLGWTDNSTNETGFQILQSVNSTSNFQLVTTAGVNATSFTVNLGTKPVSGTYYYKLVAINGTVKSAASNMVNAQVTVSSPVPGAPTNLSVTVAPTLQSSKIVVLKWTDNSSIETGYNIYSSNLSTGTFTKLGTIGANKTIVAISPSVTTGTEYYQVKAVNNESESTPLSGSATIN